MPEQTNYEKAMFILSDRHGGYERGSIRALLAIADELRELREHLTGERERKLAVDRFHLGIPNG